MVFDLLRLSPQKRIIPCVRINPVVFHSGVVRIFVLSRRSCRKSVDRPSRCLRNRPTSDIGRTETAFSIFYNNDLPPRCRSNERTTPREESHGKRIRPSMSVSGLFSGSRSRLCASVRKGRVRRPRCSIRYPVSFRTNRSVLRIPYVLKSGLRQNSVATRNICRCHRQ